MHSLPAAAALLLGVVYAVGAVSIYGQIKGAGLNAVQTMPLVPLEQILGRGIGSVTSELAQATVSSLLVWALIATDNLPNQSPNAEGPISRVPFPILAGILGLVIGGILISVPPAEVAVILLALAALLGSMLLMLPVIRRQGLGVIKGFAVAYLVGILAYSLTWTIAESFLIPPPLPAISLTLDDGGRVKGGAVATSGATWYVTSDDHSIAAIPSARVRESQIDYPPRERNDSLLEMTVGALP